MSNYNNKNWWVKPLIALIVAIAEVIAEEVKAYFQYKTQKK